MKLSNCIQEVCEELRSSVEKEASYLIAEKSHAKATSANDLLSEVKLTSEKAADFPNLLRCQKILRDLSGPFVILPFHCTFDQHISADLRLSSFAQMHTYMLYSGSIGGFRPPGCSRVVGLVDARCEVLVGSRSDDQVLLPLSRQYICPFCYLK